jgi:argininosuccinate lyase
MTANDTWRRDLWAATSRALTAHVVMLRDAAIVDDRIAAALLTAIDSAGRGEPPDHGGTLALVAAFETRVDSLSPPELTGASGIGRARHDLAATAQRLVLRDRMVDLAVAQNAAREALLELAEGHVFTLMQGWAGSAPLQPTNLAHFLTATIAPLARAARLLRAAFADLDRSPLGAGALAGPGLPVDREETADLLGSEGPAESTLDALAAVDHLAAAAIVAAAAVAPPRRLLREILLWLRAEPEAVRLDDALLAPHDPGLPHFRAPATLERLVAETDRVEATATTVTRLTADVPYGPTGDVTDGAAEAAGDALSRAATISASFATLISGPIEFNRAWLARSAGRDLVTIGDLADFLMAEEALDPAAARAIAAMVTDRARQERIEASGITPQAIDAAALLAIGRELGVELERLGAYLAPRRFIEKRTVLGGPAAPAVREVLAAERARLAADRAWHEEVARRIAFAAENREIRTGEILAAGSE